MRNQSWEPHRARVSRTTAGLLTPGGHVFLTSPPPPESEAALCRRNLFWGGGVASVQNPIHTAASYCLLRSPCSSRGSSEDHTLSPHHTGTPPGPSPTLAFHPTQPEATKAQGDQWQVRSQPPRRAARSPLLDIKGVLFLISLFVSLEDAPRVWIN